MNETPMNPPTTHWRLRLGALMESTAITRLVTALIILNAAILGIQTYPGLKAEWGELLTLDQLILAVFILELALRFIARGLSLLRDPWAVFDCLVVGVALCRPAVHSPCCVRRACSGCRG